MQMINGLDLPMNNKNNACFYQAIIVQHYNMIKECGIDLYVTRKLKTHIETSSKRQSLLLDN